MPITVSSAKAKARRLQDCVRDAVRRLHPELHPDDITSAIMGTNGADLVLSPAARKLFNYSVECKAHARHAVYAHYDQAKGKTGEPLVVLCGDRRKALAVVDLDHFMSLLERVKTASK